MYSLTKRIGLIFCILLNVFESVNAQDDYSLKRLIDEALLNNYDIQLARINEVQLENQDIAGNAGMLPTVDVFLNNSYTHNSTNQKFFTGEIRNADFAKNTLFDVTAEMNWVVFDGFRMFARKRQLEELAGIGKVNTRFFIEQTVADISKLYYRLNQEKKLLEAYEISLLISNERLNLEEQKFEIGSGSGLDVQKALIDRNSDSSLVVYQLAQIQSIVLGINRLINRDLTSDFVATDSLVIKENLDMESLIAAAMQQNSQMEMSRLQELISQEQISINRSRFYPQIGIFGAYNYRRAKNQVGVVESNKAYGPSYGVEVRFNLFNGNVNKMNLENSKLDLEFSKMETDQLSNDIRTDIHIAYLDYKTGLNNLQLEENNVHVARQTLFIAKRQYELRVISDIEFRLIQLSAIEAETDYLRQQFIVKNSEIDLLRISGQLLDNIY